MLGAFYSSSSSVPFGHSLFFLPSSWLIIPTLSPQTPPRLLSALLLCARLVRLAATSIMPRGCLCQLHPRPGHWGLLERRNGFRARWVKLNSGISQQSRERKDLWQRRSQAQSLAGRNGKTETLESCCQSVCATQSYMVPWPNLVQVRFLCP